MTGSNRPELGALEPVAVRDVWPNEAQDFTPWLAENLDKLAAVLEVGLDLEGTEMQVGPYRADIVARIPQDDTVVLIENQLEEANLQHLGQVLAYLAGLDAKIVVWIAKGFNETHLSAIRWLNEHTADPFAFFAVKLEVVKIGDSKPAPVLDVVERPNQWQRRVQEAHRSSGLSELGRFKRDFWTHFASRIADTPGLQPGFAGANVRHAVGNDDLTIVQYVAASEVGVYVSGKWGESWEDVKLRIEPHAEKLQKAVKDSPVQGTDRGCSSRLKIDTRDLNSWDKMADWLDKTRRVYAEVLSG